MFLAQVQISCQKRRDQKKEVNVNRTRCAVFGLGAMGREIARIALEHPQFELVAVTDVAEDLVGRDLGQVLDAEHAAGLEIRRSFSELPETTNAEVVFHATGSRLDAVAGQLLELIETGANIISTCEELVFPWARNPGAAERLHEAALERGSTVVAAGVNPGFAMDLLPIFLSVATGEIREIHVERVTDIATRRLPLQSKLGVGQTAAGFAELKSRNGVGHVGLEESMYLIADALNWSLGTVNVDIGPIFAEKPDEWAGRAFEAGEVIGVNHVAAGTSSEGRQIRLKLEMRMGAASVDAIRIQGRPDLSVMVEGGFSGDECTSAVVINLTPAVLAADPGLQTVSSLRALRSIPSGRGSILTDTSSRVSRT